MFYIFSKILGLALKPLTISVALGLSALFSKTNYRKRLYLRLLVIILVVFSNKWLVSECARRWEIGRISPDSITQPYDVGILLGGYSDFQANDTEGVFSFSPAVNRLHNTLLLYKTGKIRKILLTGGSGRIIGQEDNEAEETAQYLRGVGVPDSVILIENQSRNTRENALYSKQLLDSIAPNSSCLLITSAWHLRRAHACFMKVNLGCDVFGTDYYSERSDGNPFYWIEPDWESFMKWNALIKEWIGWWAYKIKGYV